MKYLVNNMLFKTDKELQGFAKNILYNSGVNSVLEGEDLKFMIEYFEKLHHEWIDKKGVGLLRIRRVMDKVYGKYRAFQIERVDNSITDISYIIANIKTPRVGKDFKQALRWIIEPQILDFKKSVFAHSNIVKCPISDEILRFEECHADHSNPTFDEIIMDFIKINKLTDLSQIVSISRDNQTKAELSDAKIANQFYEYHKSVAVLRCVSPNANLTRKKRSNL
ncbi:DUF3223 domain-containing protein [Runella rosea]|nr:DUF3223 domain-containing protein [Runella rosea]